MAGNSSEAMIIPVLFSFSLFAITSKVVTGLPWNHPAVPCRFSGSPFIKLIISRLAWEFVPQRLVKSLSKFWPSREISWAWAIPPQLAPSESQTAPSWSPLQLKIKCWRPEFHRWPLHKHASNIATASNNVQRKWLKINVETFANQQAGYFSFCWYICELTAGLKYRSQVIVF